MNGKKGSVEIDIPPASKGNVTAKKSGNVVSFCREWFIKVWEFCTEDVNRVIFSLKVGLAVLLVSLLILFRAPYEVFGTNIIWSILTVAIMFEYTVGATFNRGFNRAVGSLLAGIIAIAVAQFALCTGRVAEPIIIGASIFFIGTLTSFMKLWPSLVQYEYGFRVILFTFCLIIVSGYRIGTPVRTAMERLYSIAIGGFVAVLVNVLICPMWAGEQLHKELVSNFDSVADTLEECVRKYLRDDGSDNSEFSKKVIDEFPDEPAYRKCRATLNNSAKLETLAISASWEPPHGKFRHLFYPWSEYVKVGAVLRYCAYEVMALHGVLHSEIQAPYNLRIAFQSEILEMSTQAAQLVRSLCKDISTMKRSVQTTLVKKVHISTERLQRSIDMHSYLLTSTPDLSDNSSKPPPKLAHALSATPCELSVYSTKSQDDKHDSFETISNKLPRDIPSLAPAGLVRVTSYHELMKKQQRRLLSWPSREVDEFEGVLLEMDSFPRMKALESTAALSLATFTSLLIEFVARLDHLVEAVNDLAQTANFKHEGI
ncbi:hypothetical protein GIB67_006324 [Kingdonia uniflora]|uniref:Aluminum-activated malate transporter n=1 Tax=Kingdonia uniflora TaxID=39325 RepID=A0A7J7P199_9MAGN|nr:hypothetical protein GIB67_006324 [Kingdonia uniflora]